MFMLKVILASILMDSLLGVTSLYSTSVNWCDRELSCDDGQMENSMCYMTREENKGPCYFMHDAMTEELKTRILALHNSFRDQLANGDVREWPPASNMRQLSWGPVLSKQATTWAFQCEVGLDPCPKNPKYPYVGQAMGRMADPLKYPDVDDVFRAMVDNGTVANISFVKPPNAYTNFVQISFAEQTKIGCGVVRYLQQSPSKIAMFTTFLVCFYAQRPTRFKDLTSWDELPYKEGEPCSHCPNPTKCDPESPYKHLCATYGDSSGDRFTFTFTLPPPPSPQSRSGKGKQLLAKSLLMSSYLLASIRI